MSAGRDPSLRLLREIERIQAERERERERELCKELQRQLQLATAAPEMDLLSRQNRKIVTALLAHLDIIVNNVTILGQLECILLLHKDSPQPPPALLARRKRRINDIAIPSLSGRAADHRYICSPPGYRISISFPTPSFQQPPTSSLSSSRVHSNRFPISPSTLTIRARRITF